MKLFFKILSIARQRKYPRSAHDVSLFRETSKCAYAALKEKRVSALTLLQEKRVSALTVNPLHAGPEAAKTKIERFRRKWKAPSESARSFLKLPFGEWGEMSKCAYVVFFHFDLLLVISSIQFLKITSRGGRCLASFQASSNSCLVPFHPPS